MFLHEKFIALFSTPLQAINAAKIKGYLTFSGYFYPHDLQKTLFFYGAWFNGVQPEIGSDEPIFPEP
jgi:hypothetical protein